MIKFFYTFLTLFLLFFGHIVLAYQNPGNPTGFVNDFADILNIQDKQNLEQKLSYFEKNSSNEITIAVIQSLNGDTIENFALKLFEDWKIGKTKKDNGALILVAIEDRKMRIEVGYGLEGALTDAQSFWIINNILQPNFKQDKYFQGLDQAVDKIISATQGEYVPEESFSGSSNFNVDWLKFLIFIPIWLASILGRSKSWWMGGVLGAVIGLIIGYFTFNLITGFISVLILTPLGLLFDYIVSKSYQKGLRSGSVPWWIGGSGGHSGGGGFGGFGGGRSGGGGSSGSW